MKTKQIRPHKSKLWKVEPLPSASRPSRANFSAPELVAMLAAAHQRIGVLESQVEELQAGAASELAA